MKLACGFVAAFFVLGAAACEDPAAPSSVVVEDNVVRLTATASARELVAGTPVTLRVTLTNEGTKSVTLHFNSGCQILPYIRDERGVNVIPEGGWMCTAALSELTLAPGQAEIQEYIWTGSTAFRSEMPLRPLPPGQYYFAAEVDSREGKLQTAPIELMLK
jgi:hypothetical protein